MTAPRQTAEHVAALRDGAPLTAADAKARRTVRLPDGTTGRLIYVPTPRPPHRRKRRTPGAQARVLLPGGAIRSAPPSQLTLVPEPEEAAP